MHGLADEIILPYIKDNKYRIICEIGASTGMNTDKLISNDATFVTIIDPCLDSDLRTRYKNTSRVEVIKGFSLDVLVNLSKQFDCILIDGDHNWYTVFNELCLIEKNNLIKKNGTIILHDVDWPYGRRDMYYNPELIPKKFRKPYAKKGILYGQSNLSNPGFLNNAYNALFEGGPKNGVLTAIEDFLALYKKKYTFFSINIQFGLGFLYFKKRIFAKFPYYKLFLKYAPLKFKSKVRTEFPTLYSSIKRLRNTLYQTYNEDKKE